MSTVVSHVTATGPADRRRNRPASDEPLSKRSSRRQQSHSRICAVMTPHLADLWLSGTTEVWGSGLAISRTHKGTQGATVLIGTLRVNTQPRQDDKLSPPWITLLMSRAPRPQVRATSAARSGSRRAGPTAGRPRIRCGILAGFSQRDPLLTYRPVAALRYVRTA